MANPQDATALVFVRKEWYDTSIRLVAGYGPSTSPNDVHVIAAKLKDADDPIGLWLTDVKSRHLTKDGSEVTMDILIPRSVVLAVGLIDEKSPAMIGFKPETVTDLTK
jgi:hypothetical protein